MARGAGWPLIALSMCVGEHRLTRGDTALRPRTTCLCSAPARLSRSLSAVAQSVASKPSAELLPLGFFCVGDFAIRYAAESSGASGGCKAEFDGVALCVLRVKRLVPRLQGLNSFGSLNPGRRRFALRWTIIFRPSSPLNQRSPAVLAPVAAGQRQSAAKPFAFSASLR